MLCLSYFSHFIVVILPQEIALASFCLIIATRPQKLGPKSIIIAQKLREICQLILPSHTKQNPRHCSIQVAVDMAKFRIYKMTDMVVMQYTLIQFLVHIVMQNTKIHLCH